ncbi:hypothetical protein HID58_068225 [Brassica napus]|uniref:Cytochrome P450 n=1 Tax=Brassica napus TaxID=3708 RepID=A0ABQ7ZKN0_BRANA|nr:hypothetical protein HID58_068225 [Brassica napus]
MAAMITIDFLNCFILIFLCFFSLLCYSLFFKKPKDGFDLPPSPPSLPIIGHLHLLLSVLPHKAFQKISSRYGPLLHLRIFKVPFVLASSASVAYELLRTHDVLVMNLFGTQALERSRGIRADELERFYARLMDKARHKENVEIGKEAMVLTNNIISKLLIGRSKLLKKLGISLFAKEIRDVSNGFDELLERLLRDHEEKRQDTYIMDILLAASRDENADYKITRNHIKLLIVEPFLAGSDSAAKLMQWAMAEIIKKPIIFERLRQEMDSVVGSFHIPEKITLVLNVYAVMRDPNFWQDPDEFKPERFIASSSSEQEEEREKVLKFLPFGSGRRGCPGESMEIKLYGPLLHLRIFKVPFVLASSASVAYDLFRTHDIERFYARLMDKARKKESVEIGKEAMVLTNNIMSKLLIGRSCSEENGEAGKVRESVTKTMGLIKKVFFSNMLGKPLKKLGISLFEKEIRGVSGGFDELLERLLREHEEKHQDTDMMDVLLSAYKYENEDYKITRNHIKLLIVELFLAGTDSAARLIQWAMAEIISKPNILERLRQEMDSPERFIASSSSEQEEEREKILKFLPSGSGRRGCPEENLGYIFVETGVGMMVQCFDWRINGDKIVNMEETLAGLSSNRRYWLDEQRGKTVFERSIGIGESFTLPVIHSDHTCNIDDSHHYLPWHCNV